MPTRIEGIVKLLEQGLDDAKGEIAIGDSDYGFRARHVKYGIRIDLTPEPKPKRRKKPKPKSPEEVEAEMPT